MSDPAMMHVQGDVNISPGLDADQGPGFMKITSATGGLDVEGATTLDQVSIDTTDGQLLVNGTNKINFNPSSSIEMQAAGTSFLKSSVGAVTVQAEAGLLALAGNSTTLVSDVTTVGITGATGVTVASTANNVTVNASSNFDVNADAAITMDSNAASNFTVTGSGNLTLDTTAGRAIVSGGASASNAVTISASNAAGGIDIDCGTGGFDVLATDGGFSIDGQNSASNITLATNSDAQDLVIGLTGTSNSSVVLSSTGTGVDAVKISATNIAGGVDVDAGTAGIAADTTGGISLDSAAPSNFTVTGAFDLTANSTEGSVIIEAGETATDAIRINSSSVGGGIDIDSGTAGITADTTGGISFDSQAATNYTVTGTGQLLVNSTAGQLNLQSGKTGVDSVVIAATEAAGGIDIDSGTSGIDILSQGPVSIDASAAASNLTLSTNGPAQDLTVSVTGVSDSSLVLSSTGTSSTDAIIVNASAGGLDIDAIGQVHIDTTDTTNGIFIATATAGVPVNIGTATSTTTIAGDFVVSGVTTTVNTETLLVEDNLIVINSGGGELGNDGGLIVRRFQTPNDAPTGDVIGDTGAGIVSSSVLQAGSTLSPDTLVLEAASSAVDDFYKGMWILITSGTQVNKVRRIKSYDGTTKTATLYMTADNVGTFIDGLDSGGTAPLSGDSYVIYNSTFIGNFYDESSDKWTLAYTNVAPDALSAGGPSTVNIQRYASLDSGSIVIQDNGIPGSSTLNVNTINEFTSDIGVTIEGVNINNGLIGGSAPDVTEVVVLQKDDTVAVPILATATTGAYMILVDAVQAGSGAGSFLKITGGTFAVFAAASTGTGGALNRLVSSRGTDNQRVELEWGTGQTVRLKHQSVFAGGLTGDAYYRVKITRVV